MQAGYRVVVTNATPIHAYRGAGRPEAAAAIERAVDLFAAEIGMDPAEVRRRNFVAPDKFPFQTKSGALYDSGRYEEAMDKALAAAGYEELRKEQERRRASGDVSQLGIGLSTYVEITAADAAAGETAKLEVSDDGTATVYTGSSPHGQGHYTAWAMLVQEELGIPMDQVTVIHGDTDLVPVGTGIIAVSVQRNLIRRNVVVGNDSLGIALTDFCTAAQLDEKTCASLDIEPNPLPNGNRISGNVVLGNGRHPDLTRLPEIRREPQITYVDRTGAVIGVRGGRYAPPADLARLPEVLILEVKPALDLNCFSFQG